MMFSEVKKKMFEEKHRKWLSYGLKNKLIFTYPDELFDHLRPFQLAGLPASIVLLVNELCNGKCYDRSMLMQLALNDCEIVHADINSLRVRSKRGDSPEHSFVVTRDFGEGREWVIDTSIGLIFDKDYYYKFEQPKINDVITKEECMNFYGVKEIIAEDFNETKYVLPLYLPFVEAAIKNSNWFATIIYREKALKELEFFKSNIGYDELAREIDEDIEIMKKNPRKLDEKFKIVRDKCGREISRNGISNPYYRTPEEVEAQEQYFKSIQGDKKKEKEFLDSIAKKCYQRQMKEEEDVSKIAQERLEKILENPTIDFYELLYFKDKKGQTITKRK